MKIGVIVDNELNNDKRVLREIEILKAGGHVITVLCFSFGNAPNDPVAGIRVERIRLKKKIKDLLFFFLNTIPVYEWIWTAKISRLILKEEIDALHVHDLYMSRAAGRGIKKSGKKIPMVLDLHENYPFAVTTYNWTRGFVRGHLSKPEKWKEKEREYLGYADRIIVLSEDFRDVLTDRYKDLDPGRFMALPNVPDLVSVSDPKPFPVELPFPKEAVIVLYFGVVAERRGIFEALDVFITLGKENHPSRFLIIGPVDKKDRERFFTTINSPQLKDSVFYIPWIDISELASCLNLTDICLAPFRKNPQHESGVANKIFDYMLGGKPVIASDCRPQERLIEKYNCGIVFSDNKGMKEAIVRLSADNNLRKMMGQNGLRAIMEEYNTERIKDSLTGLYKTLKN